MSRFWFVAALLLMSNAMLLADDAAAPADAPAAAEGDNAALVEKFTGDPNNPDELLAFARGQFQKIVGNVQSNPDLAEKQMEALLAMSKEWKIENENSKQIVQQVQGAFAGLKGQLELARISIDDLKKKLDTAPDAKSVQQYAMKIGQSLAELANSDAAAAEKQLADARDYLKGIAEKSEDAEVKQAIEGTERMFSQVQRSIESEKRLAELIGKDAAPLEGLVWVNGEALSPEQLKGKVVLLDFWAVWCGPCIATFPHLRDWSKEFQKDGLEILGVTTYYERFGFDGATGKLTKAEKHLDADAEHAMLKDFAGHHKLTHQLLTTSKDNWKKASADYSVRGIPTAVLVDRQGNVRMVRVGSGPDNAMALEEEIRKLLKEK
jgi:thiol-disulfide isomerase/thioredoxin